jgi:hypothetical protein
MAAELLKSWHAPSLVTAVEIDAARQQVVRSERARVSGLKGSTELTWTQLDEALPMPIDTNDVVMALAVNSSDVVSALNEQPLKVTGLTGPRYTLAIDGAAVGDFAAEELGRGINLAMLQTPMAKQAAEVHKLTLQHNQLHFTRWRQIQVPMATIKAERVQAAAKNLILALDEEEASVVRQQRAAAQPTEHSYRLSPASGDSSR